VASVTDDTKLLIMKKTTLKRSRSAGFTLIEIMVVVLIIGLLLGTVGKNIFSALFSSQRQIAINQIALFEDALSVYYLNNSSFPESLDNMTEKDNNGQALMKRIPLDPWKNEYIYEIDSDGTPYFICYGNDGSPGGEDMDADIDSRTMRDE
jgi:general secretion pathway protein G